MRKSFGANLVLDDVARSLARCYTVAIIGPGRSGGAQRRVDIARCRALEPKLLVLDDITSVLDAELVGEVLQVIGDLAGQVMTMLIVTHEVGVVREVAERIVVMDGGQMVEQG